jgi:hypothetical protein
MSKKTGVPIEITLFIATTSIAILACNFRTGLYSECEEVDRAYYEQTALRLRETPETPKYPDGAVYRVCYTDNELTSIRMTDGEEPDDVENRIPAGTYSGEANFYTTLEGDASFLQPTCTENTVYVVIGSDGAAQGEVRSICSSNSDTDSEDMVQTHHSDVTGVIQGELLNTGDQLSIAYTWHSYFTSPQWETTSLDEEVDFVFPYHVQVLEGVMILTPASEVEDYYSFTLYKE